MQLFKKEEKTVKTDDSPEILDLSRRIRKLEMRLVNANSRMDRIEQDFDDFVASFDRGEGEPDG